MARYKLLLITTIFIFFSCEKADHDCFFMFLNGTSKQVTVEYTSGDSIRKAPEKIPFRYYGTITQDSLYLKVFNENCYGYILFRGKKYYTKKYKGFQKVSIIP